MLWASDLYSVCKKKQIKQEILDCIQGGVKLALNSKFLFATVVRSGELKLLLLLFLVLAFPQPKEQGFLLDITK